MDIQDGTQGKQDDADERDMGQKVAEFGKTSVFEKDAEFPVTVLFILQAQLPVFLPNIVETANIPALPDSPAHQIHPQVVFVILVPEDKLIKQPKSGKGLTPVKTQIYSVCGPRIMLPMGLGSN